MDKQPGKEREDRKFFLVVRHRENIKSIIGSFIASQINPIHSAFRNI